MATTKSNEELTALLKKCLNFNNARKMECFNVKNFSLFYLVVSQLLGIKLKLTIIFIFLCASSMDTDAITSDLAIVKHTVVKKIQRYCACWRCVMMKLKHTSYIEQ